VRRGNGCHVGSRQLPKIGTQKDYIQKKKVVVVATKPKEQKQKQKKAEREEIRAVGGISRMCMPDKKKEKGRKKKIPEPFETRRWKLLVSVRSVGRSVV
jgi:hypothetical protein